MIKLLHAADLHLDSAFSALPPQKAVQRRQEQRQALSELAALAEGCDIVLLAGDLFDSAHIYRDTLDALRQCLASIRSQIFIAPGNHDHLADGSPYLCDHWSENVHIFTKSSIECVHLPSLGCDVYGAAFLSQEQPAMLQGFRVSDPNVINLMVLHGDVQPLSPYNPITAGDIAASGLTYLALGHIHQRKIDKLSATTFAYPGCFMGRGFDECGRKGVLRCCVSRDSCEVEFLPIHARRYEILTIEAGENALTSIQAALPKMHSEDCYRIVLNGESNGIDIAALHRALAEEFYSLSILDRTTPKASIWSALADDTLRGCFLRELKAQYDAADETQQRRIAQAATLVLALMDGREVTV